jgi:D-3-phosphoglycerate dehydrogenase / 2-oxoglutarate reductase
MKIFIADSFSSKALKELRSLPLEIIYNTETKNEGFFDAICKEDPNVLVVRSTNITADLINSTKSLSLIVRAGAGVNTIDVKAASNKGVFVSNCPGLNSDAVAELVIGLMIAIDRNIPANVLSLRQGVWNKKLYSKARGLKGSTLE